MSNRRQQCILSVKNPALSGFAGTAATSLILFCLISAAAKAQNSNPSAPDLASQSLEDLMKIKVTSASKKSEALSKAPAAIFVLTGDDIRRGGYSSIPDALRSVPGMYVVQQSSHVWLVSARGFSNTFNDKMLVLIDGRVIYSSTFGGVYWDVQDPPLEDLDRIEVIRGPGGTLWGDNAVNGVINIITKDASKTEGPQVVTSAGVNEGYASRLRYGGTVGDRFAYRIYGTSNYWLPTANASNANNYDQWNISQGGARFDWKISDGDTLEFDGEGYSGHVRDSSVIFAPTAPPALANYITVVKGGHLLAHWKHTYSQQSSTDVSGYCDWNDRVAIVDTDHRATCDVEVQHNYALSDRQTLTFGGGITTTEDNWPPTFTTSFTAASNRYTVYSGLLQYDAVVVPDKVRFIIGSKFDDDSYTGYEYQPQVRAVWTPNQTDTIWFAVSRAIRTPDKIDEGLRERFAQVNPFPPPLTFILLSGEPTAQSENLNAYELGYRYAWKEKFSADAALYYNGYGDLSGLSAPGAPIVNLSPLYIDLPEFVQSIDRGQTHGLELFIRYVPVRRWAVSTAVTELRGTSTPGTGFPAIANNPKHEVNVQSRLDLTRHLNFDSAWYFYDAIAGKLHTVNRIDLGISTNPIYGFTFSLWGRNIQQERHVEAIPENFLQGEIRRSVIFKLTWEPRDPNPPKK